MSQKRTNAHTSRGERHTKHRMLLPSRSAQTRRHAEATTHSVLGILGERGGLHPCTQYRETQSDVSTKHLSLVALRLPVHLSLSGMWVATVGVLPVGMRVCVRACVRGCTSTKPGNYKGGRTQTASKSKQVKKKTDKKSAKSSGYVPLAHHHHTDTNNNTKNDIRSPMQQVADLRNRRGGRGWGTKMREVDGK